MPQHATSFKKAPTVAMAHPVVARCFIVLEITWPRGLNYPCRMLCLLSLKSTEETIVTAKIDRMKGG